MTRSATSGPFFHSILGIQNCFVVHRAVQDTHHVNLMNANVIENQIVAVNHAADSVVLVATDQRISLRGVGKRLALPAQFANKGNRPYGIIFGNRIADSLQVSLSFGPMMTIMSPWFPPWLDIWLLVDRRLQRQVFPVRLLCQRGRAQLKRRGLQGALPALE